MALEIVVDPVYDIRLFTSNLVVGGADDSSNFSSDGTNYPVGYDFVDGSKGWIKSPSNAINTVIQTNGSYTWMNFAQYGYQGGRLTRSYSEPLDEVGTLFYLPEYVGGDVGLRLRTLSQVVGDDSIKILINRNAIEVLEHDGFSYTSLLAVDTSAESTGTEIQLYYDQTSNTVVVTVGVTPFVANLILTHSIQVVEFFSANGSDYPLTLQFFYLDAFGLEQRNLDLVIPTYLEDVVTVGDIIIVSSHEGSDYGGNSMLPRISGQFTALSPAKDVSIGAVGFQRFWARTITSSEPPVYKFTRGDTNSVYDSPMLVGFIVRGAVLEDLTVSWSEPVTGVNAFSVIASNSCEASEGDLVYGYAHNESNYDQMYSTVPSQDFLWYQTFPYGVTSLREAGALDDGIVRFQHFTGAFDYKIFAARISDGTVAPTIIPIQPKDAAFTLRTLGFEFQGGRPVILEGRAALEQTIGCILIDLLELSVLLRTPMNETAYTAVSSRIKTVLNDPANWFTNQQPPIVVDEVKITAFGILTRDGVSVSAEGDTLYINIGYTDSETGISIPLDSGESIRLPLDDFIRGQYGIT
jgi:hypothetical protein